MKTENGGSKDLCMTCESVGTYLANKPCLDCTKRQNLVNNYKRKKLRFEDWWRANVHITAQFEVAEEIWNAAQENK